MLLIAGGEVDSSINSIVARAERRGIEARTLLVGAGTNPSLVWSFEGDRLTIDEEESSPSAVFIRYDVFGHLADGRPETAYRAGAWYTALQGWMLAHPAVRMLNRRHDRVMNKPFILHLAAQVGLRIPSTRITNELDALEREAAGAGPMIAKPITGGGYAQPLEELLAATERRGGRSAAPAFVQQRLVPPEVRVYAVGTGARRRFVAFRVESAELDYRADDDSVVVHLPLSLVEAEALGGLGRLMDALEMDYGAADFKADPDTGRLAFMEVNSGPMFAGFDAVSDSAVSDAILDYLTG
ncbi:MAG: RimK family alpha-L-glutamate ligase [Longimicrobiaceae bacterium]